MILDACCGAEKMYHGAHKKLGDDYISVDIRRGDFSYKTAAEVANTLVVVRPRIIADMQYLPFKSGVFDTIVCDPPHMDCGLTGFMAKAWGSWGQKETIEIMTRANEEFARVLKSKGTLVLKIMPDTFSRFEKTLTNFVFYLPIQTVRPWGCMESREARKAALWYIATRNQ